MPETTFPATFAEVFSNNEPGKPAHEILVVDRRTRFKGGSIEGDASVRYPEYLGSLGANASGWLKDDRPTATPEGIFAFLCLDQLSDRHAIRMALVEFSKIEECAWARTMLKALDDLNGIEEAYEQLSRRSNAHLPVFPDRNGTFQTYFALMGLDRTNSNLALQAFNALEVHHMSAVDKSPRFAVRQDGASGYFVIDIFWPDGSYEQLIGLFESNEAAENWIANDSASALAQLEI